VEQEYILRGTYCTKLHVPDPHCDAIIAATALVHGMTVVTRNVDDFKLFNVELVNPCNAESI
jgi:toxin FitB